MTIWLVIGYVACFVSLVTGAWVALSVRGSEVRGLLIAAGALIGMAILRCLEEIARRLQPPEQ